MATIVLDRNRSFETTQSSLRATISVCLLLEIDRLNPLSVVFGGWVAMLKHAMELLDRGYNHVIRLIIPVFKALSSYECTV
jgi:hypothetical protein